MKKTILLSVLATLCLLTKVFAQEAKAITALQIGDTLPPLTFSELVNSKQAKIQTEDHQDQLLIIDFWATWCTSCIKMFPAIEELQERFKGRVQFLAVNSYRGDTRDKVQQLFARHPEWTFPTVYGDTVLAKLFPHQGVPHYIWIKNNRYLAASGPEAIHADTLAAVLSKDHRPYLPEKTPYQMSRPLFAGGNGGEPAGYLYRSLLTPYMPQLQHLILKSTNEQGLSDRFLFVNETVDALLGHAYPQLGLVSNNRIIMDKEASHAYQHYENSYQWYARHLFTYEALFPPRPAAEAQLLLQEDIRRYFGLKLDSAIQEQDCLVFTGTPKIPPGKPGTGTFRPETNWYTPERNIPITFRDYLLSEALQLFDEVSDRPVINETPVDGRIDLRLHSAAVDEQELRSALQPYGIQVRKARRKIKVYLINKTNPPLPHLNPKTP